MIFLGGVLNKLLSFLSLFLLTSICFVMLYTEISYDKLLEHYTSVYQNRLDFYENHTSTGNSLLNHKYMSFSVDDTIDMFYDLYMHRDKYNSIFENPTLSQFKKYHDLYGLSVTFFCFNQTVDGTFDLSMLDDRFVGEFQDNSDWLRFGFHAISGPMNYENTDSETASRDYYILVNNLTRITGGNNCVDRVVRLANYKGNRESIEAFKSAESGIVGLLTADDDRDTYYFTTAESSNLKAMDASVVDGIEFYATDIRLETTDDIIQDLENKSSDSILIIFTHEWLLDDEAILSKIDEACNFAVDNDYIFGFPHIIQE